jgi:DNA-binding MarR family transcriptional regulator
MSAVPGRKSAPTRAEILEEFARVGREHSDATVLFHGVMASLLDLHPTDYKTLGILERLGPVSAGEIASHSGLASASVTNLLDRLERKGFVRRVRDVADRRRVLVEPVMDRLTAGRERFASTRRSLARLVEQYSTRDLAVITDFLARNAERLRAETRKLEDPSCES